MPVERSEPGGSGFRDCARNDEVEDPTLYDEHRDVMLRAVAASRNRRDKVKTIAALAGAATGLR